MLHTPALPGDAPGRLLHLDGRTFRLLTLYRKHVPGFGRCLFALWSPCDREPLA